MLHERFPELPEKMTITRYALLSWMVSEIDEFKPEGRILEIGSSMSIKYMFKGAEKFVTSDAFEKKSWHPSGQPIDRKEDVMRMKFWRNSFDYIIIHQVLEHVQNLHKASKELYRVLKPGGILWFSSPFIDHYHPTPKDYWRISRDGYEWLFRKFKRTTIKVFGNMDIYPLVLKKEERKFWDLNAYGPSDEENPLQLFGRAEK